jgi:hypothetical protein
MCSSACFPMLGEVATGAIVSKKCRTSCIPKQMEKSDSVCIMIYPHQLPFYFIYSFSRCHWQLVSGNYKTASVNTSHPLKEMSGCLRTSKKKSIKSKVHLKQFQKSSIIHILGRPYPLISFQANLI